MDWVGYRENWRWMSFPPRMTGSEDDGDGTKTKTDIY